MRNLYRIFYSVDEEGAHCSIYSYPILEEKNSYYTIRSGERNRRIKKEQIGVIDNVDTRRTAYYVFLTDLDEKDQYIVLMADKVKSNAYEVSREFQKIYENANACDGSMVEME